MGKAGENQLGKLKLKSPSATPEYEIVVVEDHKDAEVA